MDRCKKYRFTLRYSCIFATSKYIYLLSGIVKIEKEISADDSPEAGLCISIENIRTVSCKEENIKPEIKREILNEVVKKEEENYDQPTFWSVCSSNALLK